MIEIGARFAMNETIRMRREGETIIFTVPGAPEVRVSYFDAAVLSRELATRVTVAGKMYRKRIAAERRERKSQKATP